MVALMLIVILFSRAGLPSDQDLSKAQARRSDARAKQLPVNRQAEAEKVAEQLKLLIRFIYVYGRISANLESLDEQIKQNGVNPDLPTKMEQSKARVVENIKGLRIGFERLAEKIATQPGWRPHSPKLIGAVDRVAQAEQLASNNRFDEAGRTLLGAAERLVDLLVEIQ